jgi:hypothetical protein
MRGAVGEANGGEFGACAVVGIAHASQFSGVATFSSAVIVGMRWKDWNPHITLTKRARSSSPKCVMSVPERYDRPRRRGFQPAINIRR